jgi:hypothetical protein
VKSTTHRRGAGLVTAVGLVLAAVLAPPSALASQAAPGQPLTAYVAASDAGASPQDEQPSTLPDESPSPEPHSTPAPTDGEVVYDGPFLTPTPDPTPVRDVRGATAAPEMTPPSTDTLDDDVAPVAGTGLPLVLLVVAGLSPLILLAGRTPAARRS